jgi:hypothetical protein
MEDSLNAIQDARQNFRITDITSNELRAGVDMGQRATMNLRDLRIEDADAMTLLEQSVHEVGTDESGASSNQYVQFERPAPAGNFRPRFAGAGARGTLSQEEFEEITQLR